MPSDDIQVALSLLDEFTIRQLRDGDPAWLVEHLFVGLGYTVHRRFTCRAHMDTWTWLMQDRRGEWLLYRLGTEDFSVSLERAVLPLEEAWGHVSLDQRVYVLTTAMNDTFEPVRGATPDDLLLAILTVEDFTDQADLLGVSEWLVSEQGAKLNEMRMLAALSGHSVPASLPVLPYVGHLPLAR